MGHSHYKYAARTLQEQTGRFRGLEASVRLFKSEKTKVLRTYQILLESLFPAACQRVVCGPPAKLQIRFFLAKSHESRGNCLCDSYLARDW